jgi:hypothetical protein
VGAKIFVPTAAVTAGLIGAGQPGNSDPFPDAEAVSGGSERLHAPDDLVTWGDVSAAGWQITLGQVQVGTAYPATGDPDPYLALRRHREIPVDPAQRSTVDRPAFVHHPSLHLLPPVSRGTRARVELRH